MSRETIVVKYGSDSVADEHSIDYLRIAGYSDQLAELHDQYGIVVVSSGAVAVGKTVAGEIGSGEVPDQQTLAMMGSADAYFAWKFNFSRHNIRTGQLLVTHHEIDDKQEKKTMIKAINQCHDIGVIPIANENDALSDEELKKLSYGGDNDGLARHIAVVLGASKLMLLTHDKPGLLNKDKNDELVPLVSTEADYERALSLVEDEPEEPGGNGTGGMRSKVEAAWDASVAGVDAYIGRAGIPFADLTTGVGTYFPAKR